MKKTFIVAIAAMMSSLSFAQTVDNHAINYSVTYEKEHLFLQKDSGFNVVDYEIEWPNVVDFNEATPLKQAISKGLTGIAMTSLDSLLNDYNSIYGNPVSGPFKTIPDDNRFCYISSTAKIVGYQKGHWIAYYLDNKIEPQKLSKFTPLHDSRIIVYDISRNRMFMPKDLIRPSVMQTDQAQYFYDFYSVLFSSLSDDFYDNMSACEIDGVWTEGSDLCFLVSASTEDQQIKYTAKMPLIYFSYVLTRDGKKIFTKDVNAIKPQTIMAPITWHGDTIYNNVEKMPVFKGGDEGLKQYLSHVSSPVVQLDNQARVYVSYIVDKDGNIQDVSVVSPANPILDSHAVSIIKGMPRYTPGEQNGKKVCVRLYMPITYR